MLCRLPRKMMNDAREVKQILRRKKHANQSSADAHAYWKQLSLSIGAKRTVPKHGEVAASRRQCRNLSCFVSVPSPSASTSFFFLFLLSLLIFPPDKRQVLRFMLRHFVPDSTDQCARAREVLLFSSQQQNDQATLKRRFVTSPKHRQVAQRHLRLSLFSGGADGS